VILVDDVLTTGATLVACATALGEAGWPAVQAVTFARAMPYELGLDATL
jgi:predicted amidophosphoribosyltransferase